MPSTNQAQNTSSGRLVKTLAIISLVLFAVIEFYFFKLKNNPAGYAASALLIFFGLWRIDTEKDPFQKLRIITILSLFVLFWCIIPLAFGVEVPILGGEWRKFPAIHIVGSITFFIYMGIVLLFGRRVDCGWCCPCVTARETIGYPFRDHTPKNGLWWKLRHLKLFSLALLLIYLTFMLIDAGTAYNRAGKFYYDFVTYGYYASLLLIPLTGNRNFCRILCPYAALWGVLSISGFYRIKAKKEECIACRKCEDVCDMGIPIAQMVKEKGQIRSIECMGCGRCVNVCPQQVLSFHSAAGLLKNLFPLFPKQTVKKQEY
jgi:polyferredoxin